MNASGRRQRQAKNNFSHLSPRQRPNYKKRDANAAAMHQRKLLSREQERRQRGAKF